MANSQRGYEVGHVKCLTSLLPTFATHADLCYPPGMISENVRFRYPGAFSPNGQHFVVARDNLTSITGMKQAAPVVPTEFTQPASMVAHETWPSSCTRGTMPNRNGGRIFPAMHGSGRRIQLSFVKGRELRMTLAVFRYGTHQFAGLCLFLNFKRQEGPKLLGLDESEHVPDCVPDCAFEFGWEGPESLVMENGWTRRESWEQVEPTFGTFGDILKVQ
ncbi:hypothetical protein C8R44DRAFT_742113 [Mycena epipterygia]|nr:hypothetical protein C8R44DRAFT_742113 [Mycena epipterygia]